MVELFRDDDAGFTRWRDLHPDGYIVNHAREPGPAYLKLHRSDCSTLQGALPARGDNWTIAYAKSCSARLSELQVWAGSFGGELDPCRTCAPR